MFPAIRTIFRTWSIATRSRAADNVDIEAQVATASYSVDVIQLPIPSSSCLHQPRVQPTPLEEEGTDPIEDFFGIIPLRESPKTGTQDSRHDDFMTIFYHDDVPPPPYTDASDLPSYDAVVDPPSLAMYLFKFGFLFPLFWFAGIIILISPLSPPEGWEPLKTDEERQELIELLRRAETKWAKRCLYAFIAFIFVVSSLATIAIFTSKT